MKRDDFKNLKTKKIDDLQKMAAGKKLELMKLLSNKKAKGEKNVKKGRNLRKEIAQILTLVGESELK